MNYYDSLDLDSIKKEIAEYAAILDAKEYICNEEVPYNPLLIKKNITETNEALKILNDGYIIGFDGIYNINNIFEKADLNILLNGNEINKVLSFHNHCERIKKMFTNFDVELSIRDYSDAIMLDNRLYPMIETAIDTNGNVKENASDKLITIYKELNKNENQLLEKAQRFISNNTNNLQEAQVYSRNNRLVFLVKNAYKNKYGGFAYGYSSSGLASYVEPQSFVELNNKKQALEEEKDKEIEVILQKLTYLVASVSEIYRNNFESLVKLCVIFAKANYGFNIHGNMASLGNYLELENIAHPLIDQSKVVSNSYDLKKPYLGIVISGSNTGGKTVSLKLIGLSIILSYLGIPLICDKAIIPLYDYVFVDIDDNQSIVSSLSTFSAHITNIDSILEKATNHSLILIDELISGTDPKQAQAISIAIIEQIKKIGASFVITTHFDDIKNYAYEDEEILLSAVGFDLQSLKPTYKYLANSVGASNALEIASRYFTNKDIILRSKEILETTKTKHDELMDSLSLEVAKNVSLNEKLENTNNELSLLKKELESKISAFEIEKEKLRTEYLDNLKMEIEKIKEEALNKLNSIKDKSDKTVIKEIENLVINDDTVQNDEINIGDSVVINDNEQHGKVIDINKDNITIDIRGIKVKTKLNNIHKVNAPKIEKTKYKPKQRSTISVSHELNLIGQRVEEALINLEDYLDKAYAANYSTVRIIHGFGTGALKNAVHDKLKKLKFIKSYKLANFDDGGSAITIVEFKK